MDPIERLRAELNRDPSAVADAAGALVDAARQAGDATALGRVLAVRGRARRYLGQIDLAVTDLTRAIAAAQDGGDDDVTADAHIGLALALVFAGRPADAFGHLDQAHRIGSATLRAYAALQRCVIHQRVGDHKAALAGFEAVLPALRALDLRTDIAKVLVNRGVLLINLGDCDGAVSDYTEAAALFEAEEQPFGVAETEHGLGWAHARRGDLPRALSHLDRAAELFHKLGHAALEVDVDRIEVLLAAGLGGPATDLAVATAERLTAAGNQGHAAETWLLCARAAQLDGDHTAATRYAERARASFAKQGSVGWERTARLEVLRAAAGTINAGAGARRAAGGGTGAGAVHELRALGAELDAGGNARGAATAYGLAAVAACEAGDRELAAALSAECAKRSGRLGILEVRMLASYAGARCALLVGDRNAAARRIRAGLAHLHRHRATLAATDARASVAVHAAHLTSLGLRLAMQHRSPAALLRRMEQARAGATLWLPSRPPEQPELAADLAALRAVVSRLRERESAGADTADLLRRQRELEHAVHRRQLRATAARDKPQGEEPGVADLRCQLRGRTLISIAEIDGQLVGVRIDDRRPHVATLGPASIVYSAAAAITSALRCHDSRRDLLRRATLMIDRAVSPLLTGDGPLVLVVPAALHAVPWHLLPCLERKPVALAPSVTWWYHAEKAADDDGGVIAVSGPHLAEADREAAAVAGHYPQATLLTGASATTSAVLAAISTARVAHLACHGVVRHDNPLWSALELSDGPLYAYDLERLPRTPPLVVLSGCHTGVGVRAGDALLGLATALLVHGTRRLVAAVCALPDTPRTAAMMAALHARVAAGASPASALAELAAEDDAAAYLSCFGTT
ncbi:CHAT domain-containing protein [Paractinoplanes rishiriensis]|nr:CHAT domain-containing protein [Actinoplanes rishiriensis]